MKLPNWICFGVVKGGTTSLFNALKTHSEIYIPPSKETHFFCSPEYNKGLEYYAEQYFSGAKQGQSCGDISPKYFIHQDVPGRIYKAFGSNIKLLIILRNPVERAWSHYCHSYERFHLFPFRPTEDLSFKYAIQAEKGRLDIPDEYSFTHHMWNAYKHTGRYAFLLKHWLKVFKKENIEVCLFEDLINDSQNTLDKITSHIEVSPFKKYPLFTQSNSYSKSDKDEQTLSSLRKFYRPDITELEDILKRDLSTWK